ncbi:MAG: lysophospholipase [Sciscionella sp.]
MTKREFDITGHGGNLAGRIWATESPRWLALIAHGYGEHTGRYAALARSLCDAGGLVVACDHLGHGRSAGERVLITDFEQVVADLHRVRDYACGLAPGIPLVLIGHSMGGMIAARYAQRFPDSLDALVLSGPVLGNWAPIDLLEHEVIPATPIDPAALSRDPAVGAAYQADPLVWHGPFKRATLRAFDECLQTIAFDHPLGDELPALWLHGAEDEFVPVADTRAGMDRIRGLGFVERLYPGARHEVFNETNATDVIADLLAFVAEVLH